jgi:prolyl-tRNA synthetase
MGSYGIGIERAMAAVVERCHDANGIVWPMAVAPYEVVVTLVKPTDPAVAEAGGQIYDALRGAGIDVLLDDRDERPGVMLSDCELIGIPHRVVIGDRGLKGGTVEYQARRATQAEPLPLEEAVALVKARM